MVSSNLSATVMEGPEVTAESKPWRTVATFPSNIYAKLYLNSKEIPKKPPQFVNYTVSSKL